MRVAGNAMKADPQSRDESIQSLPRGEATLQFDLTAIGMCNTQNGNHVSPKVKYIPVVAP
jgi:hypothetical protein